MFKRGRRVRLWYRSILLYVYSLLYLPFLLTAAGYGYFYIYQQDQVQNYSAYIPIAALLVLGAIFLLYIGSFLSPLRFFFMRLYHKQMFARYILANGFYEKRKDGKIGYYAKIYLKYDEAYINVRFLLDMERWQNAFLTTGEQLGPALYADLVDVQHENFGKHAYISYRFLYAVEKNRLKVNQIAPTEAEMQLMKHITWNFAELPHALIVGGTGSGKTIMLLCLIYAFKKLDADVIIGDPKKLDLSYLENQPSFANKVFYKQNGIEMAIRKFVEEMDERIEHMRLLSKGQSGKNYADLGLRPHFLVFDEYVAFLDSYSRDQYRNQEQVISHVKRILLLGRQAGFFIILAMQRADAKYLPDGMRDQFGLRISLGKNSPSGYNMIFGDYDKKLLSKATKGFGHVTLGTNEVKEFYSPLVSIGFNFIEEIGKLPGSFSGSSDSASQPAGVDAVNEPQA